MGQLEERAKELEQIETWKKTFCRECPYCGRAIERIDGCNRMVCGRDTHAETNRLYGCGKVFDWRKAPPYRQGKEHCEVATHALLPEEVSILARQVRWPLTSLENEFEHCDACC